MKSTLPSKTTSGFLNLNIGLLISLIALALTSTHDHALPYTHEPAIWPLARRISINEPPVEGEIKVTPPLRPLAHRLATFYPWALPRSG